MKLATFKRFNNYLLIIGLIYLLAVGIRLIYFNDAVTFFYDQSRDALVSMEIWRGDPFKLLGPQTDIPALHHGPLYWYLISPIYHFTDGNVYAVRFFLILLSCATIFFIYDLTNSLFKNRKIAYLAIFLYAISFEATQYARWLSNPAPAILTVTISFWSLRKLYQGKGWALISLLVSWGLSVQLEFFMLYQMVVFPVAWIALAGFKLPNVSKKIYFLSILGLFLTLVSFALAELKFNFQGVKALSSFMKTQTLFGKSFSKMFLDYLDRYTIVYFYNLWGVNLFISGLLGIISAIVAAFYSRIGKYGKEVLFLLLWVLSPICISFFAGTNANFVNVGGAVGVIILSAFLIYEVYARSRQYWLFGLILLVIVFGNMNLVLSKNKEGEVLFTVQDKMLLGDELKVIDYVYKESKGEPFRINTVTSPLFINTTWALLFNWYGRSTYGYMPYWWGETQVDVPGSKVMFGEKQLAKLHFLIMEPEARPDDNYTRIIRILENTRSKVVETKKIGSFTIEKREITNLDRIFTLQDVFYEITTTNVDQIEARLKDPNFKADKESTSAGDKKN